ncbi:NFACT family protein [Candidatus Woesearchaeota archaeon]|nr:NFACT family protein [Candidatus Woesearchaeota archaeon]
MKTLSALDLHYLVQEFQFLINARIDKIYCPRKKEIFIEAFAPTKGKFTLKIDEKTIFLTELKPASKQPSEFCMFLRKKLANARIRKIQQLGFERIIALDLESKAGKFQLIAELFSKGNLILAKTNKILIASEYQNWKDRTIRPNIQYKHPEKEYNFLTLKQAQLQSLLSKTNKENLVKALAIDLGLGGIYSEEACLLSNIDKNKTPKELSPTETQLLYSTLEKLKSQKPSPTTAYKDKEVFDLTPFPLKLYSGLKQEKAKSFSSILNDYFSNIVSIIQKQKEHTQIKRIQDIIKKQKTDIASLEKQEQDNHKKAEILYNNYQLISKTLTELNQISKKHSWKEIKEKLKTHKLIKQVIPAEKSVVIELK